MEKTLSPGAIGIKGLSLAETIELAAASGFDSITFDLREADRLAQEGGVESVRVLFDKHGIRPGYWGLPVAWRDDSKSAADLAELPRRLEVANALGCQRAVTGIMPGINDRTYDEQFAFDVERMRPAAQMLADAGCRIGIEFIGPKTLRSQFTHEYIYNLPQTMEFAGVVGTGNIGLLLDAWHLYTSHGSLADLDGLTAGDIVAVHVNDAPVGIPVDEQMDLVRALPLETGVLDIVGFMQALQRMGYDGPVMPEPFSQRIDTLAATDPLAAARETAASMDALWRASGLTA
jgi:sugar phosphate isomerase/epimerase